MAMSSILQLIAAGLLGSLFIWIYLRPRKGPKLRTVAILVLGDIGRSPRMMYHAESLAQNQFETYIIGNKGSKPIPSLLSLPHVHFLYLPNSPQGQKGVPFVITASRKILAQIFTILEALLVRIPHPPEFILVQNPPSIPTLALVWFVSVIRGSKVIIDWHNLGYSILALKLGNGHPFVKIAKWFEAYFGKSAYAHLFVTRAMHDHLVQEWGLQGQKVILHDRPPAHFHRTSPFEMHELFNRLETTFSAPDLSTFLPSFKVPCSTPFTAVPSADDLASNSPTLRLSDLSLDNDYATTPMASQRSDRPALLVSSTSWTPDEDFGILLDALSLYERKATEAGGKLPKVLMIVTGKGPDRQKYMKRVQELQSGDGEETEWKYVRCVSMWLEAADYPLLLGSADLGISLHSSSSALDLPMKVVDMFGCGLPVCALDFACLDELVKDGINGLVFNDAEQLATQLQTLLLDFPESQTLATLRLSLQKSTPIDPSRVSTYDLRSQNSPGARGRSPQWPERQDTEEWEWSSWSQNWDRIMRPLLLSDVHQPHSPL